MTSNTSTVSNWKIDQLDDLTGKQAAADLRKVNGVGTVELIELDLASVDSIHAANAALREHTDGLDAIINNAGITQTPQRETADGFELQFGTNHLGHFLVNHLMFDLVAARSGRIVPVSSIAHRSAPGINVDDPMFSKKYSSTAVYAHSKLANLIYGFELARRPEAAGSDVKSVSVHPGYSATNLQSTGPTGIFKAIYKVSNKLMAQPASVGAIPEVLAAAGNEAQNVDDGTKLWELSERLLGIEWKIS